MSQKYKNFLRTTSNIDVDNTKFEENTNLKMTRPAFGGHLMATIILPPLPPADVHCAPRRYADPRRSTKLVLPKVVVEKVTPGSDC